MTDPVPIEYSEFYDVPRLFVVTHDGVTYLFDAPFDDSLDDYPDSYAVSTLPPLRPDELAVSWASLPSRAVRHLGSVPVSAVAKLTPCLRIISTALRPGSTTPRCRRCSTPRSSTRL